jgi:hypothetical protein
VEGWLLSRFKTNQRLIFIIFWPPKSHDTIDARAAVDVSGGRVVKYRHSQVKWKSGGNITPEAHYIAEKSPSPPVAIYAPIGESKSCGRALWGLPGRLAGLVWDRPAHVGGSPEQGGESGAGVRGGHWRPLNPRGDDFGVVARGVGASERTSTHLAGESGRFVQREG